MPESTEFEPRNNWRKYMKFSAELFSELTIQSDLNLQDEHHSGLIEDNFPKITIAIVIEWKKNQLYKNYNMQLANVLLWSSYIYLSSIMISVGVEKSLQTQFLQNIQLSSILYCISEHDRQWGEDLIIKDRLWGRESKAENREPRKVFTSSLMCSQSSASDVIGYFSHTEILPEKKFQKFFAMSAAGCNFFRRAEPFFTPASTYYSCR